MPIPNLTHGQMAVIARHKAEILDLADRQVPQDREARRLLGFISIQSSACLWGLVPGSLGDEASPFNECTHAYLAATQAVFLHLLAQHPGDPALASLADRLEGEMLANGASLQLCRYSGEAFSTAAVVAPRWAQIPAHPKSFGTFALLVLASAGAGRWAWRWGRT